MCVCIVDDSTCFYDVKIVILKSSVVASLLCIRHITMSAKPLCFRSVRPRRSFVRLFVQTNRFTTISHERPEQS